MDREAVRKKVQFIISNIQAGISDSVAEDFILALFPELLRSVLQEAGDGSTTLEELMRQHIQKFEEGK